MVLSCLFTVFVISLFRPNDALHNYATTFVKVQCCMAILYGMRVLCRDHYSCIRGVKFFRFSTNKPYDVITNFELVSLLK